MKKQSLASRALLQSKTNIQKQPFFRLLLVASLVISIFALSNFIIPKEIDFIGYSNEGPLFHAYKSNEVYVLKKDSFSLYKKLPLGVDPISANGSYLLAISGTGKSSKYILYDTVTETTFDSLNVSIDAIVDKDGCVFFIDKIDHTIKSPNYPIRGNVEATTLIFAEGDCLYYCLENPESVHPDATIHQYQIKNGKQKLLGDSFMYEGYIFLKGANKIYAERLIDGRFRPVIVDIKSGKIDQLGEKLANEIKQSNAIFYQPETHMLCTVKDGKLEIKKKID